MKLSVLTTIYNGEEYVEDMLGSVLNQTYSEFEWIIVDDGSTDDTWEMLSKVNDPRIKKFKLERNFGVGYASSFALSKACGDYVAKVDADDINDLERFTIQMEFLDENEDIDLVDSFIEYFPHNERVKKSERFSFCQNRYVKYVNRNLTSEELSAELYWGCVIINSAMMGRREKILQVGYAKEMQLVEDYLLFYEMNKLGMKFYKIPKVLVKVRISENSTIAQNTTNSREISDLVKKEDYKSFLANGDKPIAIWGAGNYGRKSLEYIISNFKIKPRVFFDSNSDLCIRNVEGIPIIKPNSNDLKKYKIIIASTFRDEIESELKINGLKPFEDYYIS